MKRKLALLLALLVAVVLTVPAAAAVPPVLDANDFDTSGINFDGLYADVLFKQPSRWPANLLDGYDYYAMFWNPDTKMLHILYATSPVFGVGDILPVVFSSDMYSWGPVSHSYTHRYYDLTAEGGQARVTFQMSNGALANTYLGYYLEEHSTAEFAGMYELEDVAPWIVGEPRQPPVIVDISALVALIAQARAIVNDGYTEASWSILQSSITSAQALLDSGTYTQDQVDSSYRRLSNAINSLSLVPVDPPPVDPGDHRYLVDGITISDLLPYQEAVLDNMWFAIRNGIGILAVLLGIWIIPRLLFRLLPGRHHDFNDPGRRRR